MVMSSYKLVVQYDGTRYNGFQRQTSNAERPSKRPRYDFEGRKKGVACTIQDCLEEAFLMWLGKDVVDLRSLRLRFAGRTDKGVHARGQVVAVDLPSEKVEWEMNKALNSRLPMDVSVASVETCAPTFEPRQTCIRKRYSYTIRYQRRVKGTEEHKVNGGVHMLRTAHDSPILWLCPWSLDDSILEQKCKALTGTHDFSPFVHKDVSGVRDCETNLELFQLNILDETSDSSITAKFVLEAKGFGRNMVRNLVGFVVDQCRGQLSVPDVWTADLNGKIHAAPASGLCLEKVWY